MAPQVTNGAMLQCSFGAAPSTLLVMPKNRVFVGGQPAANITDSVPMVNVPSFGMCSSLANPAVAAATSAALGVLTPMPCTPVLPAPWAPGSSTVTVGNMPALNPASKCMCAWGGVIQINFPGQVTTHVP